MNPADFAFLAELMKSRSGLILTPDKSYLVESRLGPLARAEGLSSVDEFLGILRGRRDERLMRATSEAMLTNETFFFRDKTPFDLLKEDILPPLVKARAAGHRLRIWCAAASTGQEPYSIAMLLDQNPRLTGGLNYEIIATDLSEKCLERAKSGLYTQFEVQRGLPIQMLMGYFEKVGDSWRINEKMRNIVQFKRQNLLEEIRTLGRFDIVFCRNVLIYFDQPTKRGVLERIAMQIAEDGQLLLGAAETVIGLTDAFKPSPTRRGLYARNPEFRGRAAA